MKKDKLIGIIIPVYNVEQYIRQCLDSILDQDYQNYIVLLVDDGSTDLSVNVIEEYLKRDKRFVLIKKSNGGLSSALNAGINYFYQLEKDNLKIDYLIFLDGDDYWDKNCLSQCVCNMDGVQAVWFDYRYIFDGIKPYDNDYTRMDYLGYKKEQIITPMDFFKRVFITKEWHAFAKMGMINFDFLRSIKLEFKEGLFLEDHLFGVIFFASSHKIKVLPLKLYNYRIRANSLCNYNKNKNSTFMPAYFHKKYNSILYDRKKYDELGSKLIIGLELEKFIYNYPNKKINFLIKNFLIEYYFQESSELLLFPADPLDYSSNLLNRPSVSAKRIIKESLEYKIGYMCKNIRNVTKCFNLLKNTNQKSDYDLTVCTDYHESLKLKNHLNFILGKNIIMMYNKIRRLFILLYPLIFTYSYCEFIFKKKYKPIVNNLNKIDNISFAKLNDLFKMVEITISKYIHQYNDAVCLDLNVKEGFLLEALKHYNIKIYGYEYNEYFYFALITKYANCNNIFLSKELVINHEISLESLDYTTNDDGYGIYIYDDDSLEERKCIFLENIFNKYQHIFILSIYLDFYNYKILSQIFKNEKKILYIACFVDKFFKESEEFKKIYNQFKHKNIFFIDYSEMKNKGKK